MVFYDKDKQFISVTISSTTTFTTPEKCEYIRFAIQSDTLPSWVQIEVGNTKTSNIEHQQEDYLLYIQQEMLEGDYFVREADGWKEVHYRPILTFTGEEDWLFDNNNSRAYINLSEKPDVSKIGLDLSNYFTTGNTELSQNCFNVGTTQLFMKNLAITTLNAWKAWLAQQNEAGMPIKVYYVAETPTKLPCTPEQSAVLEELSNLDLFDGVNNIITAENIALLKLKYSLDVKTYVNNQLANVNAQILEIVGGN